VFIKENMKRVMAENPGSPQKDIMGLLGKGYREGKAGKLGLPGGVARQTGLPDTESVQSSTVDSDVRSVTDKLGNLDL